MNLLKLSGRYLIKNKARNCILLLIFTAIFTLLLISSSIQAKSVEQSEELKEKIGASFTISQNLDTGKTIYDNNSSYIVQEFITDEMIETIMQTDGIKTYNVKHTYVAELLDRNENRLMMFGEDEEFFDTTPTAAARYVYGVNNSEMDSSFMSGSYQLAEGRHITENDKNVIVIPSLTAEEFNIEIGDTLTLHASNDIVGFLDTSQKDYYADFEVIGFFDIINDTDDLDSMYPIYLKRNEVYADINPVLEMSSYSEEFTGYEYVEFYVSNPDDLSDIIHTVQNISSIEWNNFTITSNNGIYEISADSIANISGTLHFALFSALSIVSLILVITLLFWMNSRLKEAGILMSLGKTHTWITAQRMIEGLLIGIAAMLISFLLIKAITENGLFIPDDLELILSSKEYIQSTAIGILIIASTIYISLIPLYRLKPRDIFTK